MTTAEPKLAGELRALANEFAATNLTMLSQNETNVLRRAADALERYEAAILALKREEENPVPCHVMRRQRRDELFATLKEAADGV